MKFMRLKLFWLAMLFFGGFQLRSGQCPCAIPKRPSFSCPSITSILNLSTGKVKPQYKFKNEITLTNASGGFGMFTGKKHTYYICKGQGVTCQMNDSTSSLLCTDGANCIVQKACSVMCTGNGTVCSSDPGDTGEKMKVVQCGKGASCIAKNGSMVYCYGANCGKKDSVISCNCIVSGNNLQCLEGDSYTDGWTASEYDTNCLSIDESYVACFGANCGAIDATKMSGCLLYGPGSKPSYCFNCKRIEGSKCCENATGTCQPEPHFSQSS